MYCELFHLDEPPFRLTPDPQYLYSSKQHARAKAYMESSIWLADGFVVITGEIGAGKTTLIESFLEDLPDNVVLAHINQTQLTPVEFLQALLVEFGFKPFRKQKVELLSDLKDFLIARYAEGKTVLLIVDEAQNLSRRVLEEIRMLSGIEAQKEKLLRIILAGQPELLRQLEKRKLEQLKQRVRLQFHLGALSKRETREYIEHRLNVAGANGRKIFDEAAFDPIFTYSGGVPRLINTLCDTALLCGFAEEKDRITEELVMTAVEELQWIPFADRYRKPADDAEDPDELEDTGRTQMLTATQSLSAPLARIEVLFRDQPVARFDLRPGRTIIGRTSDNDLQIESKFISRHHAQIVSKEDRCTLEDLNSTNGIFVGSQRVKFHQLSDGDVIHLGEHKLVYSDLRPGTSTFSSLEADEASDTGEQALAEETSDTGID